VWLEKITKGERVELETIPQPARERIDQIAKADLLVGVLTDHGGDAPAMVRQALEELPETPRTVIIQGDNLVAANGLDSGAPSEAHPVFVVPWTLVATDA
jgi:hypothetical protein